MRRRPTPLTALVGLALTASVLPALTAAPPALASDPTWQPTRQRIRRKGWGQPRTAYATAPANSTASPVSTEASGSVAASSRQPSSPATATAGG